MSFRHLPPVIPDGLIAKTYTCHKCGMSKTFGRDDRGIFLFWEEGPKFRSQHTHGNLYGQALDVTIEDVLSEDTKETAHDGTQIQSATEG